MSERYEKWLVGGWAAGTVSLFFGLAGAAIASIWGATTVQNSFLTLGIVGGAVHIAALICYGASSEKPPDSDEKH